MGDKTHTASSVLANHDVKHTPVPCSAGLFLSPGLGNFNQDLSYPALQDLSVTENKQVSRGLSEEDG